MHILILGQTHADSPPLHGDLSLHFIVSLVWKISGVFDSMLREVDLQGRPPQTPSAVWSLCILWLNTYVFFQLQTNIQLNSSSADPTSHEAKTLKIKTT